MEAELAKLLLEYLDLAMQAVGNILELFDSPSISFPNVWGLVYGAIVVNYNLGQFASEFMHTTKNSTPALSNLSLAVSYLGTNATTIFGDLEGSKGVASIQKEAVEVLLTNSSMREELANDFAVMLKNVIKFVTRLLQNTGRVFL